MKYLILVWIREGEESLPGIPDCFHEGWNVLFSSDLLRDAEGKYRRAKHNWSEVRLVKTVDLKRQRNET